MKVTIKEIYDRGEISNYTYSLCIVNKIKTFKELHLHYLNNESFKNLDYCNRESCAELIEIYYRYRDVAIEDERKQAVSINKSKANLKDIVTDFDKVIKATPTINTTNAFLEEKEQELQDYWNEIREKEAPQNENSGLSIKSKDIVDLYETNQTIEGYRRIQVSEETTMSTATTDVALDQRLKEYWREKANEETKENDGTNKSIFGRHPSKQLNDLYSIKSYQGANPVDAKVIFVGRDPNWAAGIEET
ncbi:MAG: hypothetical protein GX921_03860, partial [Bacteroidales bacterium]|nr:hypothetical protein [Bacteroidales bacterium]